MPDESDIQFRMVFSFLPLRSMCEYRVDNRPDGLRSWFVYMFPAPSSPYSETSACSYNRSFRPAFPSIRCAATPRLSNESLHGNEESRETVSNNHEHSRNCFLR